MDHTNQPTSQNTDRPTHSVVPQTQQPSVAAHQKPQHTQSQSTDQVSVTGGSKEFAPQLVGSSTEVAPIVEIETEPQAISPEVQEYVQKVSSDVTHPEPVIHEGQVYAQPVEPQKLPDIVLPLTQQSIEFGMKQKVSSSIRWLAVWCLRIMKKFKGRVVYSPTTQQQAE